MTNLFRGKAIEGGTKLEKELETRENQAAKASPGYETQFLNRAGNLCVEAGQAPRALAYYGRAIDAYLESGRFSAAEVLCRKLLQISPRAVRARCTLAWLALGKGFKENTRQEIKQYVDAAERAGQQRFAAKQLLMMAEASVNVDLRQEIADHLLRLEAAEEADHVYSLVFREQNGIDTGTTDESKLWGRLLRAALMGPKELQQTRGAADDDQDALPSLIRDDPRVSDAYRSL